MRSRKIGWLCRWAVGLVFSVTPLTADIATGVVAQYGFEGNMLDSVSSYDGTPYGTPGYASGRIGQAIVLDGLNSYVTVPMMHDDNVSELTFSGWFYIDSNKPQQILFANGEGGELYAKYEYGSLLFSVNTVSYSWQTMSVGGAPVDSWAHFAFVYRKGVGLETWVNGALADSLPLNDSSLFNPIGWHSHIGAYNGNSDGYSFQGNIDDFRVHARALNAADIAELIALGMPDYDTAVGSPGLNWSSQGNALWSVQDTIFAEGASAPQSGTIADGQASEINTTVIGPASISFGWKVSSEANYDYLVVRVNGAEKARISGEVDWTQITLNLPDTTNTVSWSYEKDSSVSEGQDAGWIDGVTIGAALPFEISPLSVDFEWWGVGETSYTETITLTNLSAPATTIYGISTTDSNFQVQSHTCGTSLAAASSCTIDVVFSPGTEGSHNGQLMIETDNVQMPAISVMLSGMAESGYQEGNLASITLDPAMGTGGHHWYSFSEVAVGSSVSQTFTMTNTGEATLYFYEWMPDFDAQSFTVVNQCEGLGSLAMGQSCTIELIFHPQSEGCFEGYYDVAFDGYDPNMFDFAGGTPGYECGDRPGDDLLDVSPSSNYSFGNQPAGSTVYQTFTLLNYYSEWTLDLDLMPLNAPFFIDSHTCGAGLPVEGTCEITVGFAPAHDGWFEGALEIVIDQEFSQYIYLQGEGSEPEPSVTVYAATPTSSVSVGAAQDFWEGSANMGSVTYTVFYIETPTLFESGGGESQFAALAAAGYTNTLDLGNLGNYTDLTGYLPANDHFTPLTFPLQNDAGYELHVVYYQASSLQALQDAMADWDMGGPPAKQYIVGSKEEHLYLEVGNPQIVFRRDVQLDPEIVDGNFEIRAEFDSQRVSEVRVQIEGTNYVLTNDQFALISTYAAYPEGGAMTTTIVLSDSQEELFFEDTLPLKSEIDPHIGTAVSGVDLALEGSLLTLSFSLNQAVESVYARAELYRGGYRIDEAYIERWNGVAAGDNTFTEIAEQLFYDIAAADEIRVTRVTTTDNVGILQVKSRLDVTKSVVYNGPNSAYTQSYAAGWNLSALPFNRSLSAADMAEKAAFIHTVWVMRNGAWHAWAGDSALQAVLDGMGIAKITVIEPGEGFWIRAKSAFSVSYMDTGSYNLLSQTRFSSAGAGWHLLGSGSALTPQQMTAARSGIEAVWTFKAGQWRVYAPDSQVQNRFNGNGISTLESIAQGDGLWMKVQ